MPRVRVRVVVPAALAGIVAIVGARVLILLPRPAATAFVDDWDRNTAATASAAFRAVQADPALHRLAIEKTAAAYRQGGWPAASQVFFRIIDSRVNAYAGDEAALACHAAWQAVFRALRPAPHLCRQAIEHGTEDLPAGVARAEIGRKEAACDAMTSDGGERRLAIDPPHRMSTQQFNAAFAHALDGPKPLTGAERRAVSDSAAVGVAGDAALCSGRVAQGDNIAALPPAQAASYVRASYAVKPDDFVYLRPDTTEGQNGPPPDLHCAAAGTRFTLSMEARANGRPVVWESLGQRGWDCRLRSSLSGEHGLFMWDNDYAPANAMRQLWPLAVGKTAHCHCTFGGTNDYRVSGVSRYWLPWGRVESYAIDETTNAADGEPLYTVTRYWAPSLGFFVGYRTVSMQGTWPDGGEPDWQLVAVQTERVASAPAPLPKVFGPGFIPQP